jgi:hypothetical protein
MRLHIPALCVAAFLTFAGTAHAQRPHGTPPGQLKKNQSKTPPPPPVTPQSQLVAPSVPSVDIPLPAGPTGPRVRTLGVWLDDATVFAPGEAWLTLSVQRWGSPVASGFDLPVLDVAAGLAPRVHVSASVTYSRATVIDEPQTHGLGDFYLGGKFVLRDAVQGGVGIAVGPALEVLTASSAESVGLNRVNAVLPVSLEWRQQRGRVYATTGYFTRGIIFGGGAVERYLGSDWVVVGALTAARSTDEQALAEEIGLKPWRLDATGSLAWVASPSFMLFGAFTRTLSGLDADSTRYAFSGGAALNLNAPRTRPTVP